MSVLPNKNPGVMHPLAQFKYCPKCGGTDFRVINEKARRCEACDFTYYFNPSAAVACLVTDKMRNVLISVRGKEPAINTYDLPGGFIDLNETAEEGMARELLEETGIHYSRGINEGIASPLKYLFSLPNIYPYSGFEVHTLDMFFHLEVETVMPYVGKGQDDVAELVAIPMSQLHPEDFGLESIRHAVEMILAGHYF